MGRVRLGAAEIRNKALMRKTRAGGWLLTDYDALGN